MSDASISKTGWLRYRYSQVLREPVLLIGILAAFAVVVVFVLYPIFAALNLSLHPGGEFSFAAYQNLFTVGRYQRAMRNSLLLGAIVATTATFVGFMFAFAINRIRIKGRRFFQGMAILPIISPPFMFALSVILLFGRAGLITRGIFDLDFGGLYGLPGLVLVQTIGLFPIAYLTLAGILQGIDPDLETGAANIGATRFDVFRTITVPLAAPGIVAAWLLVFVLSMTDFGNPIMIGDDFDVMSVMAYLEFTGRGNLPRGAALAIMLIIPTVSLFFFQKWIMGTKNYATMTGKSSRRGRPTTSKTIRITFLVFCSLVTLVVLMFYGVLLYGSFVRTWSVDWSFTLEHFNYSWDVGASTFRSTLIVALAATPLASILGMFIAFVVVRRDFPGRNTLHTLSMLSYAVPGTAIGIGYILAFNTPPIQLTGTPYIIIAAFVFRTIPITVEGGIAALRQISSEIEESSTNLGATTYNTLRKVTFPLVRPAIFSGATFTFVRSMTAISAVIFLVTARWNHLTVLILAQTEILRLGVASVMASGLVLFIMVFIYVIMKITGLGREQVFGTTE